MEDGKTGKCQGNECQGNIPNGTGRGLLPALPALRACTARNLRDATAAFASVSHAGDSTIGSNFCQARDSGIVNLEW